MALNGNFAIMDAIDFTLTPLAGSGTSITINYLNDCNLTLEAESMFARIKGNNAVPFQGNRTGITYNM